MSEQRPRPRPLWMEPNQKRVKRSQKHERRLARETGSSTLPRSGGAPFSARQLGSPSEGGDFESPDFLYEHKSTERESMSLKLSWLRKVTAGARRKMKSPSLIITFTDPRNRPIEEWVAVRKDDFLRLIKGDEI